MTEHSGTQETLPIPGYRSKGYQFYAQKFSRSVDARIAIHQEQVSHSRNGSNIFWDSTAKDSHDAGRLLVPTRVFDEMRYIAIAHGFGVSADELPPHNALWDEVLESSFDEIIKRYDGQDAGYVMSVSAYDLSRNALIRILIKDQMMGNWHRSEDWQVDQSDLDDEF